MNLTPSTLNLET